jgi:hypothetical protein
VRYSKNGRSRRVETGFNIHKGDSVIFDKSLPHEVELTQVAGKGAQGRWTVLIGARAPRDTVGSAARRRWLYGPPLYPILSFGSRANEESPRWLLILVGTARQPTAARGV